MSALSYCSGELGLDPEIVTKSLKAAGEQTLLCTGRQLYLPGQEGCVGEQRTLWAQQQLLSELSVLTSWGRCVVEVEGFCSLLCLGC